MSAISYEALQTIRSGYESINRDRRPEKPSGQCGYIKYDSQEALGKEYYALKYLNRMESVQAYEKIFKTKCTEISESDFMNLFAASLSLTDPTDASRYIFKMQLSLPTYVGGDKKTPSSSSKIRFVVSSSGETISVLPSSSMTDDNETEDTPERKGLAAQFLCAWALRFCIKVPSAALNIQIVKMRETFLKFYGFSAKILDNFNPSSDLLKGIQSAFQTFPVARNTIAYYLGENESQLKPNPKLFNIGRYLFFQNFEFMGMHIYVSVVNILHKVPMEPGIALTWLRINGSENAIDEVADILKRLDNGMIQGGDTAERVWKYARMINEGYFNRLQTSYAPDLIAVLAYIEIKLGLAQETGYASPLNIYAIKNNTHLLEVGKAKAELFMECKNAMTILSPEASVIDRAYAQRHNTLLSGNLSVAPPPVQATKRKANEDQEQPRAAPERKRFNAPNVSLPTPPNLTK